MAGDPQFGPAPDLGSPSRAPFPSLARDRIAQRMAVDHALADGASPGAAYARAVRPMLVAALDGGGSSPSADIERALVRSCAQASLAVLSTRLPVTDEGLGRRAVVLTPPGPLGELDGRALADALDAGGWSPEIVALDQEPAATVARIQELRAEVALVPAGDPGQLLAARQACSLLRRIAAPPLVVAVTFAEGADAPAIATDHHVGTTDALPALLRRRMGRGSGPVPWGVRLGRDGDGLTVAPGGLLDPTTVARLREIVDTRRTLYPRIVIDLRELLATDTPGLTALVSWDAEHPWSPTISALGDPRTLAALDDAGLRDALPLARVAL
jgi:hypothetical protein